MDNIAFTDVHDGKTGVRILINGRELIEVVREVEAPFAAGEGHPNIAGSYTYFGARCVFHPARHFLGEPANDWSDGEGRIYLLSCTCGFPGCWALTAQVQLAEDKVIWSDFRQLHRGPAYPGKPWRYDGFGPFEFDRASYEQALNPPNRLRTLSLFLEGDYRFLCCEGFDVDPVSLPIPDKLKKELADLHQWFQELYGPYQKPPDEMESRLFDEQGIKLWRELQQYVNDEYHVVYFSREFDDYFATPDSLEAMWKTVVMG